MTQRDRCEFLATTSVWIGSSSVPCFLLDGWDNLLAGILPRVDNVDPSFRVFPFGG